MNPYHVLSLACLTGIVAVYVFLAMIKYLSMQRNKDKASCSYDSGIVLLDAVEDVFEDELEASYPQTGWVEPPYRYGVEIMIVATAIIIIVGFALFGLG